MAKMKLSEGGFKLIPEGTYVFKIASVDDSKYEKYGKLEVKLVTKDKYTHTESYTFISVVRNRKEINEGALKRWSYFARVCLNNFSVDEIDTQDVVGCYIQATVKHEKFTRTKGDHAGEEATAVRLNDFTVASGWGADEQDQSEDEDEDDDLDLDEFDAEFD